MKNKNELRSIIEIIIGEFAILGYLFIPLFAIVCTWKVNSILPAIVFTLCAISMYISYFRIFRLLKERKELKDKLNKLTGGKK